jgi:hypothetical protein
MDFLFQKWPGALKWLMCPSPAGHKGPRAGSGFSDRFVIPANRFRCVGADVGFGGFGVLV